MNRDEIQAAVLEALTSIAPEADLSSLQFDKSIREQLDIDSMDFLNFVIMIHKKLHVDIPERDYPKLVTINACVQYLEHIVCK
jgi:acyl carrier protein